MAEGYGIKISKDKNVLDNPQIFFLNFLSNLSQLKFHLRGSLSITISGFGTASAERSHLLPYTPSVYLLYEGSDGFYYPNQNIELEPIEPDIEIGCEVDNTNIYFNAESHVSGSQTVKINYFVFLEYLSGEDIRVINP